MTLNIAWLSAVEITSAVRDGSLSVSDIADAVLERIRTYNPKLNAFVSIDEERIRRDARLLDKDIAQGKPLGPLHGVPYALKALTKVAGETFSAGLVPLRSVTAETDDVYVTRLKAAGGLFVGLTNTSEAGYYSGANNHLWGATHNPWKYGSGSGGSSGGSAAAVAAGFVPIAEGGDGLGSNRTPAALCGVIGMKPSAGRIPSQASFSDSSVHGPIARTVDDIALVMDVLKGPSRHDPRSLPADSISFTEIIQKPLSHLRIAFSPDLGLGPVDGDVAAVCRDAIDLLRSTGFKITDATPAWSDVETTTWQGVWVAGQAKFYDLLDWETHRGSVDDDLISLFKEASGLTAIDLGRLAAARVRAWKAFEVFMRDYDILISPTVACTSFSIDQTTPTRLKGASLQRRTLGWLLTYPFNLVPVPALSIPAGQTPGRMPVGLQLIGNHLDDSTVLQLARTVEQARPWHDAHPSLAEFANVG